MDILRCMTAISLLVLILSACYCPSSPYVYPPGINNNQIQKSESGTETFSGSALLPQPYYRPANSFYPYYWSNYYTGLPYVPWNLRYYPGQRYYHSPGDRHY